MHALDCQPWLQGQFVEPEIGRVRILGDMPGIHLAAHEPAGLAREAVAVVQIRRQHYAGRKAIGTRAQRLQAGGIARPVVAAGHVVRPRGQLIDSGEDEVRGLLVPRQIVRHGTHNRVAFRHLCQSGSVRPDADARHTRIDGLKISTDPRGSFGLEIPDILMRGRTCEEHQNDTLRPSSRYRRSGTGLSLPPTDNIGEPQPERRGEADL